MRKLYTKLVRLPHNAALDRNGIPPDAQLQLMFMARLKLALASETTHGVVGLFAPFFLFHHFFLDIFGEVLRVSIAQLKLGRIHHVF